MGKWDLFFGPSSTEQVPLWLTHQISNISENISKYENWLTWKCGSQLDQKRSADFHFQTRCIKLQRGTERTPSIYDLSSSWVVSVNPGRAGRRVGANLVGMGNFPEGCFSWSSLKCKFHFGTHAQFIRIKSYKWNGTLYLETKSSNCVKMTTFWRKKNWNIEMSTLQIKYVYPDGHSNYTVIKHSHCCHKAGS